MMNLIYFEASYVQQQMSYSGVMHLYGKLVAKSLPLVVGNLKASQRLLLKHQSKITIS